MDTKPGIEKKPSARDPLVTASRVKILSKLQRTLHIKVKSTFLLNRALTHRSFSNEQSSQFHDNERLEYLGDSVLALIVNEYLYKRYEDYLEGDLAKIKSTVVSEEILSLVANEIDLGEYILLGKGEEHSGGRTRDSILANTLEAVIGALYLENGFKDTRDVVLKLLKKHIEKVNRMEYLRDPKTALQEYIQKKYKEKPIYEVTEEKGPDHLKEFTVRLLIKGREILSAKGTSKRRAEMAAARSALEMMYEGMIQL
jgi:ribonuclease III